MKKMLVITITLGAVIAGCSIFVKPPLQEVKGSDVVCILWKET